MSVHIRVALACVLFATAPAVARGQARPAPLLALDPSTTVTSLMSAEAESPIAWVPSAAPRPVAQDTARAARRKEPSFIKHVGFGILTGLVIGAGLGVHIDMKCRECLMLATPYTTLAGAGLGGLVGLTIWNLRTDP